MIGRGKEGCREGKGVFVGEERREGRRGKGYQVGRQRLWLGVDTVGEWEYMAGWSWQPSYRDCHHWQHTYHISLRM